jgi:hypothetical protein
MQELLLNLEWGTVLVSFVLSFGLGWLWYSDKWFGVQWRAGKGGGVWQAPLWMPMSAQAGSTLLLAIITNLAAADGHVGHAVLVAVTIAGFIKANGLYSGKSKYAVGVEAGFIMAMIAIMVAVNMVL